MEQVRQHGLPDKLDKFKDSSAVNDDPSDNSAVSEDPSDNSAVSDNSSTDNLDIKTLKTILHKYSQAEIGRSLEKLGEAEDGRKEADLQYFTNWRDDSSCFLWL